MSTRRADLITVVVLAASVLAGGLGLAAARAEPPYAFAGESLGGVLAEVGAGYALVVVGLIAYRRRPENRFGLLLAAAGVAWLATEWNNPGTGSALVFTAGLVLYAVAAALVGHAALAYPEGRLSSPSDRAGVAIAYVGALVVLGLLPALFFDPASAGCSECPENLLAVGDSPGTVDDLSRLGVQLGLVWSAGLVGLMGLRLARATEALRGVIWPVLLAGGTYLGLVAASFAHSLDRGFVGNDPTDTALRVAQACALGALAGAVVWGWIRARTTRGQLAGLVLELARSPAPGALRDALAETLGDPAIELAYPIADGRLVDGRGKPVTLSGDVTALVRDNREVAFVSHRPGLLDDPGLAEELAGAARLALENERLRAQAEAQLEDLRASRARVIATGDAERRRLERDLHDGAQQKLVGLSLTLRLARTRVSENAELLARIERADQGLHQALGELRELANGIFPAVLADEGLSAAFEALAEDATVPVKLGDLPEGRFESAVEAAAYMVGAEATRSSRAGGVRLSAVRRDGRLVVTAECPEAPARLGDIEDRVGALDGRVDVTPTSGETVSVRAEIPCA